MRKALFVDIICCLFVVLFVYAAINKLSDFQNFQMQLGKSPIITTSANWISWTVPIIECLIAVFLAFKRFQLHALYASFSLMVAFTAYIYIILNYSPYVPCSCGGVLEKMNWSQHLLFNIGFVLLGITGVLIYPYKIKEKIAQ